jgi:hypothetical protein
MSEKKPSGHPPHIPTKELRQTVADLFSCGVPRVRIAERMGINEHTLRKYYQEQMEDTKENMAAALAKNLFQDALNGNSQAREFWLKCQARWSHAKPPEDDKLSKTEALLEKIIDKL